jgi:hypothetical protein
MAEILADMRTTAKKEFEKIMGETMLFLMVEMTHAWIRKVCKEEYALYSHLIDHYFNFTREEPIDPHTNVPDSTTLCWRWKRTNENNKLSDYEKLRVTTLIPAQMNELDVNCFYYIDMSKARRFVVPWRCETVNLGDYVAPLRFIGKKSSQLCLYIHCGPPNLRKYVEIPVNSNISLDITVHVSGINGISHLEDLELSVNGKKTIVGYSDVQYIGLFHRLQPLVKCPYKLMFEPLGLITIKPEFKTLTMKLGPGNLCEVYDEIKKDWIKQQKGPVVNYNHEFPMLYMYDHKIYYIDPDFYDYRSRKYYNARKIGDLRVRWNENGKTYIGRPQFVQEPLSCLKLFPDRASTPEDWILRGELNDMDILASALDKTTRILTRMHELRARLRNACAYKDFEVDAYQNVSSEKVEKIVTQVWDCMKELVDLEKQVNILNGYPANKDSIAKMLFYYPFPHTVSSRDPNQYKIYGRYEVSL